MTIIGKNGLKINNLINKNKTIFLLNSIDEFKKNDKVIINSKFKIITFDYNLHKLLQSRNIPHKTSDQFINNINEIQELSRKFSYWYKELDILDYIQYEKINLGKLFYPEFHYFLVPFLKYIFEISIITKKYENYNYVTSFDLFEITKLFSNLVTNISSDKKLNSNYLYDSLKIPIRIGNLDYSFRLPKTLYKNIKNISETILKSFLNEKYTIPENPSILLVEFDTFKHRKFFESSNSSKLNLVNYGRRRPAIWNKSSFNIIKNSNCLLIDFNKINDKNFKKIVDHGELLLKENLNKLWKKEEFFEKYFSLNGQSLWPVLKTFFIDLCTKRFFDAILEIEIIKNIFKLYNLKNILIFSEHGFNEQIIIEIANQKNIPITLLQHGVFNDTNEAFIQNVFAGVIPVQSNFFIPWGNSIKKYCIDSGINSNKIIPFGSISYDEIFEKKKNSLNLKSDYILFALAWPGKNQVNDLTTQTLESFEKCIKEICTIVTNKKKKLIIKIHPYSEQEDVTDIIKKINSEIIIIKNGNILDLILSCEIFITLDLSTTILEAQILEKPSISIIVRDTGLGTPSIFHNDSCIRIPIDQLKNELDNLSDPDYRKIIINNANNFVKEYISNSSASSTIISYLEKF